MTVPEELLEILRCIECHSPLEEQGEVLICTGCDLRYPVEDGIPIMLAESAYREEAR